MTDLRLYDPPIEKINPGWPRSLTILKKNGMVLVYDSPGCLFRLSLTPEEARELAVALSRVAGAK